MRKYLIPFLSVFLVSMATGQVFHEAEISDGSAELNTTVQLECDTNCPVNQWNLNWEKPENSEVLFVNDSYGEVEEYSIEAGSLNIETNRGEPRQNETVLIGFRIEDATEEFYEGLYQSDLRLPGFEDQETSGVVRLENLVSGSLSHGYDSSYSDNQVSFQGEGPVNLMLNHGDGESTEYYEFFGERIEDSDIAYEVSVGTTGMVQDFERFPVVVLPDNVYEEKFNDWSAGKYSRGLIGIRESSADLPVLAHETVHGLNEKFLSWDRTDSSYFDEGVAMYVETRIRERLFSEGKTDRKPSELFGEEISYTVTHDSGDQFVYTIPPRGDREELWWYYETGSESMKNWNTEGQEGRRSFGYAYSQLLISNYVVEENSSVRDLYSEINIVDEVDDTDEKWSVFSEVLDMEPCNYGGEDEFEQCLESINSYDYPVYSAEPDRQHREIELERIEMPDREVEDSFPTMERIFRSDIESFLRELVESLDDFFRQLFN